MSDTKEAKEAAIGCLIILLCLVGVAFVPAAVIWSLNTLFLLAIPITFQAWLATAILLGVFTGIRLLAC